MAEIVVAKNAGFCPGVKRAAEMLETELEKGSRVYCLGELIHNKTFNENLKKRNVKFITPSDIDGLPDNGVVFIRTHGEQKVIYEKLHAKGIKYIDATCPYVSKIHNIVSKESENGGICVILGDKNHPEVKGVMSFAGGECEAFSKGDDALEYIKRAISEGKEVFVVTQTTLNTSVWKEFEKNFKTLYTNGKIFDTICSVTDVRQKEALGLASEADMVAVVGSRGSSNTEKLFEIASEVCKNTIFIENAEDLAPHLENIKNRKKIAIIAGASTPGVIIQEVKQAMTETANQELSFAELLDKSFKTLNIGERVTGTILAVTPAEIKVDLGTKHTGILPVDELSADGEVDVSSFRVGDPIDAVCTKFSEVEGTVMLSKKRLDEAKNIGKVASAYESGEILHGTVKDTVKGGVIVNVGGVRVFVPAGQCGADANNLESLRGQKVPVKIIDYNAARKRVVGSIRTAKKAERKQILDEFYSQIETGKKITGTVRSVTNYGAFVNIGPTDGMIHVSEMFWGRPRNPAELFKVGDTVEVFVKEADRERERISLGYKTEETNPWNVFKTTYKAGDVVNVTIVSLMPFGAFAEIVPGVDGLIHCSQIGRKFVPNPASVLKVGEKVDAKITAIDEEKNRVSLSIKALLEPEEVTEEDIAAANTIGNEQTPNESPEIRAEDSADASSGDESTQENA